MTTSLKRPLLSKPKKGEKISEYSLAFARARNRNKANSLLLKLFQESGLSKKEIADMLGKKPEQITRWLGGPGNVTLDTISDLAFAMQGNFIEILTRDELSKAKSNHSSPEWISISSHAEKRLIREAVSSHRSAGLASDFGSPEERITENKTFEVRYATGS